MACYGEGRITPAIYIPEVNYTFMIACVALVLAFKSSSNLAAAYGIAVTGLMLIITENVPFAIGNSSVSVQPREHGFYRVLARVGFMQQPNVPRILARCEKQGLVVNDADTTYYLGRQTLLTTGKTRMARWRKILFSFLAHNSRPPTVCFALPPNRVVELGLQIEL